MQRIATLAAAFFMAISAPALAAPAPKVTICHHTGSASNPFVTITVSSNALPAHTAHGDTIGACPTAPPPPVTPPPPVSPPAGPPAPPMAVSPPSGTPESPTSKPDAPSATPDRPASKPDKPVVKPEPRKPRSETPKTIHRKRESAPPARKVAVATAAQRDELPKTGLSALALVLIGAGLIAAGLLARRYL